MAISNWSPDTDLLEMAGVGINKETSIKVEMATSGTDVVGIRVSFEGGMSGTHDSGEINFDITNSVATSAQIDTVKSWFDANVAKFFTADSGHFKNIITTVIPQ